MGGAGTSHESPTCIAILNVLFNVLSLNYINTPGRHTFYSTSQFICVDFSKLPSNILEMSISNLGDGPGVWKMLTSLGGGGSWNADRERGFKNDQKLADVICDCSRSVFWYIMNN